MSIRPEFEEDRYGFASVDLELARLKAEIERLRRKIAEMAALAQMVQERVDALIELELAEAGREALAAHSQSD